MPCLRSNPLCRLIVFSFTAWFTLALASNLFAAGELDCTFDGDGRKVQNLGISGGTEQADDLEVLADGSIVTLTSDGDSTPSGTLRFTRFLATGALDTTFGGGTGLVAVTIPGVTFGDFAFVPSAVKFARDSLGRYLVVGSIVTGGDREVFVARFTSAAALDTSFGGGDGWMSFDWAPSTDGSGTAWDHGIAIAVDSGDRPLVAGTVDGNGPTFNPSNADMAFARLTTAGVLDATYGSGGITLVSSPGTTTDDSIFDMKLDPTGRAVGVGSSDPNLTIARDAIVVRLTTAGLPDSSFDGDGVLILDQTQTGSIASAGDDVAQTLAFSPDSPAKIVISGFAPQTLAITRLSDSGALDTGFGGDGIVNFDFEPGNQNVLEHLFVQPDGKVLVTGWIPFDFSVMRLETDGDLDPSWAGDGRQTVNILNNDRAYAAGLMADGRVVLAGGTGNDTDMALARLLGDNSGVSGSSVSIVSDLPDPSVSGQPFTVAVNVTATSGSIAPTGSVTVGDGAQSTTCTLVPPGSGTTSAATCTLSLTTLGSRNLVAGYAGDGAAICGNTSPSAPHQVIANTSTTAITSDPPDPSVVGQAVLVSYSVTALFGSPSGNVTVTDGVTSCFGTVASVSCTLTFTSPGARNLTASYAGGGGIPASVSAVETHTVVPASTSTTLVSASPDPSVVGETVTVAFSVAVTSPGAGTPTGTVTVSDGVQSCAASLAAGSCQLVFNTPGARTLTATYSGDTNFNGSASVGAAHTVNQGATTVAITADAPDPSAVGETVAVSWTVAPLPPAVGTPTGTVTVTAAGGAESCAAPVATGTCSLSLTAPGARTLTATYSGDTNFNGSASVGAAHTVNQGATTVAITADAPDPSAVGETVAVSWTVAPLPPAVGTPTGTVTVTAAGGAESCSAPVAMGTCSLSLTAVGARTLTATYSGDTNFLGGSDTEPHQAVPAASTSTITADGPDPSVTGQTIQVAFAVTSPAGTPTGTVTVSDGFGGTCTGALSAGAGSCALAPSAAGVLTLTADYSGDATTAASQATASHTVNPGATRLVLLEVSPEPSAPGELAQVSFTLSVEPPGAGTPTGTVTVTSGPASCTAPAADGACSLAWPEAGTFAVTASYSGDFDFEPAIETEALEHEVFGVIPIPTLDEFGLGLLVLLLSAAACWRMRVAHATRTTTSVTSSPRRASPLKLDRSESTVLRISRAGWRLLAQSVSTRLKRSWP